MLTISQDDMKYAHFIDIQVRFTKILRADCETKSSQILGGG